ncbi:MAG: RING finger protein [Planctomycetaceae bacterium]
MSTIITCECGASVRLPESRTGRQFRCPKCKVGIALAVGGNVLRTRKLEVGQQRITCQICQTAIGSDEGYVNCPKCEQSHHTECWSEIGGCGTYGCTQAPAIDKSESAFRAPLTAWGDTKTCPSCKEEIKSIALKCRHCGTEFRTIDPMTSSDLKREKQLSKELHGLQKTVIALFIASLFGCIAPLVLLSSLVYLLPKQEKLQQAGPQYMVMGYSSMAISGLWTLGLLLFGLIEIYS